MTGLAELMTALALRVGTALALLLGAALTIALLVGLGLRVASFSSMAWPGRVLAWLVGGVLGVRRAHAEAAVRRAGIERPEQVVRAMYRGLGTGLFELIWVALHPRQRLAALARIADEIIERASRGGRGAVIATAHTGNWDLLACSAAERVPLTIATKRLSIRLFDWLWQGTRRRRGLSLVEAGAIAAAAGRALARGELVAMLIDQAPERSRAVVRTEFLGAEALVDLAPAMVAMRARVPLVAVFARRQPDGTQLAELGPVLEPPARPSRAWAEQAMVELTAALDRFVRAHPDQWLWMHRRWKGVESEERAKGARTEVPAVTPASGEGRA